MAARRTATNTATIREALEQAHAELEGRDASPALLDVLTAHVAHETAGGQKMYNHNFGGIKGTSPEGFQAQLRTHEFVGGRRRNVRDGFRAYSSIEAGARDYLQLMSRRFPEAMTRADAGDVVGFAEALQERRYFTAPLGQYAKSVAAHLDSADWRRQEIVRAQALSYARRPPRLSADASLSATDLDAVPLDPVDAIEVARVVDAMQSLGGRVGAPSPDDDEG